MHVFVGMYVNVCIYLCVCTCVCMCVCMCVCVHVCVHVYMYSWNGDKQHQTARQKGYAIEIGKAMNRIWLAVNRPARRNTDISNSFETTLDNIEDVSAV